MPSPFPGMDPYLEEPGLWPDVHHELMSTARQFLTEQVRPRYYVRLEERVFISDEDDPGRRVIIPDLRIAQRHSTGRPPAPSGDAPPGGSVAAVAEPYVATTLLDQEIHEPRIEVVDRDLGHVVTVIEILSPTNKVPGARGLDSYRQKRHEVMRSPSHWVEIDLLRAGDTLVTDEGLPPHDYLAHVSRVERRPRGILWPIRLEQRLPRLPIPLRGDDPDVYLDLQAVLDATYDRAGYDLIVDYRKAAPAPQFTPEREAWVTRQLTERGLR